MQRTEVDEEVAAEVENFLQFSFVEMAQKVCEAGLLCKLSNDENELPVDAQQKMNEEHQELPIVEEEALNKKIFGSPNDEEEQYRVVDELWKNSEQAWKKLIYRYRDANFYKDVLRCASEDLDKKREKRANLDLEKQPLGRVAKVSGKAAEITAATPERSVCAK